MSIEGFTFLLTLLALLCSPATAIPKSFSFGWPFIPSTPSHFHKLSPTPSLSPTLTPTPAPDLLPCGSSSWPSPSPSRASPTPSLPCIPFPYRRNGPLNRLPNLPAAPVHSRQTFPPFRFPTLPHSSTPSPFGKVNHG